MAAIDDLYHDHGPAILAYLRRSFGRCAPPEELLQETFLQALRHPDRMKRLASPRAWLFAVARHVGLTAARRRGMAPLPEAVTAPQPDSRLAAMREAIAALPDIFRQPLELRLHENLTYDEIALALEIPLGTVRSRLHAAMKKLRDAMEIPKGGHSSFSLSRQEGGHSSLSSPKSRSVPLSGVLCRSGPDLRLKKSNPNNPRQS